MNIGTPLPQGIHFGVPMLHYLAQPCPGPAVQGTDLKRLWDECPAYAWGLYSGNPQRDEDEETVATSFGTAFHMLLLEPHEFARAYAIKPDGMNFSTKEGKAWRAETEAAGLEIVSEAEMKRMQRMKDEIAAHRIGRLILERKAKAEATMIARDPETGLWLKCRPDFLMPDAPALTVNLKTAHKPNPRAWQRQASDLGYHISAAFTRRVAKLVGLHDALPYAFLVVGSKAPHLPFVATLKDSAMAWGDLIVTRALRTFADCLDSGKWPGYADDVIEIDLPPWEEARLQKMHEAGAFQMDEKQEKAG
ncbi:PD-(D/E)XK nuclease-like domain-containing protein [Ferrovibrio sp.]|uniref:PD-(D/E)XK nuclease-like domain-containing protein n=1 Tax=Ferrovibrio sp. TaxID=1917215 RepID=UPI0035AFCEF9